MTRHQKEVTQAFEDAREDVFDYGQPCVDFSRSWLGDALSGHVLVAVAIRVAIGGAVELEHGVRSSKVCGYEKRLFRWKDRLLSLVALLWGSATSAAASPTASVHVSVQAILSVPVIPDMFHWQLRLPTETHSIFRQPAYKLWDFSASTRFFDRL